MHHGSKRARSGTRRTENALTDRSRKNTACDEMRRMTGVLRRDVLSVSSGRGSLTRDPTMLALRRGYRRPVPVHRPGAAEYPDVCAGGTTSRSCRRTPRVSPLLQLGATLTSMSLRLPPRLRTPCRGELGWCDGLGLVWPNGDRWWLEVGRSQVSGPRSQVVTAPPFPPETSDLGPET